MESTGYNALHFALFEGRIHWPTLLFLKVWMGREKAP